MNNIELGNIDNIINNDSALRSLIMGIIKDIGDDIVFVLPEGTPESTKISLNNITDKINFDFSLTGRPTRILPSIIKTPPVVAPPPVVEQVVIPEPEPVVEQVVIAEPVTVVETTKRKK